MIAFPPIPQPSEVEFRPTFAKINGLLNYEEVRVLLVMLPFQPHFLILLSAKNTNKLRLLLNH